MYIWLCLLLKSEGYEYVTLLYDKNNCFLRSQHVCITVITISYNVDFNLSHYRIQKSYCICLHARRTHHNTYRLRLLKTGILFSIRKLLGGSGGSWILLGGAKGTSSNWKLVIYYRRWYEREVLICWYLRTTFI